MELNRAEVIRNTHHGIKIYAHVLKKFYPDEEVLLVKGNDCMPAKNPFNDDKPTLWIKVMDGCAYHVDIDNTIPFGDVFEFASLYYKAKDQELLEIINREMYLRLDQGRQSFYNKEVEVMQQLSTVKIPEFSLFRKPIGNLNPLKITNLVEVYKLIKSDKYLQATNKLRAITDVKAYRAFKAKNFDYVTFSGSFSTRNDSKLISLSGLLTIDLDHLTNIEEIKVGLLNDSEIETELLFTSPSGDGLKWIIPIYDDELSHEQYFEAVGNYLKETYRVDIDASGKNISRACFLPHDPNIYINPKYLSNE
jgi:hypothetical protein